MVFANLNLDSLPSVSKIKGRKVSLHQYACELAAGFLVGSEGRETVQFDFTVSGFYNQLWRQYPGSEPLS